MIYILLVLATWNENLSTSTTSTFLLNYLVPGRLPCLNPVGSWGLELTGILWSKVIWLTMSIRLKYIAQVPFTSCICFKIISSSIKMVFCPTWINNQCGPSWMQPWHVLIPVAFSLELELCFVWICVSESCIAGGFFSLSALIDLYKSEQIFTIFKAIQFVVFFRKSRSWSLFQLPCRDLPCHNLQKEIFEDDQVPSLSHGPHTKASCGGVARERSWDRMHSSWDLGSLALDGWWAIRNRETNIWCVKDWVTFAITLDHFLRICRVSSTRTYLSRGQVAAAKSAALWLRTLRPVGPCSISEFTRRRLCQPWLVPGHR